ncbi:MAG: cation:proton antiporter [Dehalococcoidales bacterium]|nr:cation:proton antiporter [Dehalococcoidales bacterium]
MEEFSLLKDFALIMVVAGGVTVLLRKLHPPIVLCYLVAGIIISPYILPLFSSTDVETIGLLADIGLILLLFGVGLEFGWSKIRQIGLTALVIGGIELATMISLGYGLGNLFGWSKTEALFLGAALYTSSSAIIVKLLKDMGKLNMVSSRVIVGILVVEDFAAVVIIAILSGMSTSTGLADFSSIPSLALRLVIFAVSSLALGAIVVPRIIAFTHRFHSKETLLISCLGLCFAMALLSKELGLSVATGAFLVGALVGDTRHSEEIVEVMAPVRDMFAALFFVAIGMLIDITQFRDFLLPAVIVAVVYVLGKIFANTIAAVISGYDARTSLQVGLGMPQMGEFSLAIGKIGIERGITVAPVYPIVAVATTLTSMIAPYLTRSSDKLVDFLERKSPRSLREYIVQINAWGGNIRRVFSRQDNQALKTRKTGRNIIINCLILLVVIGTGTLSFQFVENLASYWPVRQDILAMLFGCAILVLCLPSLVLIWRNLMAFVEEVTGYILVDSTTGRIQNREILRSVLKHSLRIILSIILVLWLIPLFTQLLFFGSLTLAIPALILAVFLYLVLRSIRGVHTQLEQSVKQVFLGETPASDMATESASVTRRHLVSRLAGRIKRFISGLRKQRMDDGNGPVSRD